MKVIPKQRTRSNPRNPQVHRRRCKEETSDETRGGRKNNKITRRNYLLALRRGRTSNRENLGEVQILSHNRSSKGNPLGEKLPEHEGIEVVE
jgi:hypothetical protein